MFGLARRRVPLSLRLGHGIARALRLVRAVVSLRHLLLPARLVPGALLLTRRLFPLPAVLLFARLPARAPLAGHLLVGGRSRLLTLLRLLRGRLLTTLLLAILLLTRLPARASLARHLLVTARLPLQRRRSVLARLLLLISLTRGRVVRSLLIAGWRRRIFLRRVFLRRVRLCHLRLAWLLISTGRLVQIRLGGSTGLIALLGARPI